MSRASRCSGAHRAAAAAFLLGMSVKAGGMKALYAPLAKADCIMKMRGPASKSSSVSAARRNVAVEINIEEAWQKLNGVAKAAARCARPAIVYCGALGAENERRAPGVKMAGNQQAP